MGKAQTASFRTRVPAIQATPTRELELLIRLFLFVAIGCTNLAAPVAAMSTPIGCAADMGGVWSVLHSVYHLQGLSAVGAGGTALEGGGTASRQTVTPIASINKSMTNREITVQAVIANVRTPRSERAPYIVTLTQDGAAIPLVFWSDIAPPLTPKIKDGNLVRANVTIGEYRNHVQLRLRSSANLEVVGTAAVASSEPAKTLTEPATTTLAGPTAPAVAHTKAAIGEIKRDWIDRVVTISGTISASEDIGSGRRLRIQDGTGEIQVVLWENLLGGVAATELQPGRVITLTGPVKLYRGTTEIVPQAVADVKFEAQ